MKRKLLAGFSIFVLFLSGACSNPFWPGRKIGTDICAHNWSEWDIKEAATCVFAGVKTRGCENCDVIETDEAGIDENEHDIEVVDGQAPTCLLDGYGTIICKRGGCDYTETGDVLEKRGHHFIDHWELCEIATCTEAGIEERFCAHDCGEEGYRGTRNTGIDPDNHDIEAVDGQAPTCLLDGYGTIICKRGDCDYTISGDVLEKRGHHFIEHWELCEAATCTEAGIEERFCAHDCGETGNRETRAKAIDPDNHAYQWQETAPTCTAAAADTEKCSRCSVLGTVTQTGTAALGHDWNGPWTTTGKVIKTCQRINCSEILSVDDEMVQIQSGTLTTWPAVITLTEFKMGKYEVTQELYEAVMGENPSYFNGGPTNGGDEFYREAAEGETQGKRPVEMVSWYSAIVFCNRLSILEDLTPAYSISGSTNPDAWGTVPTSRNTTWDAVIIVKDSTGYRLPTEAQWEYSCRAGTTTDRYFDDTESQFVDYLWYGVNSNRMSHEVGLKLPNAWGLYDMYGNVSEWCWDRSGDLPTEDQTDYEGISSGFFFTRMFRGGQTWLNPLAVHINSAYRAYAQPYTQAIATGFRLARP